MLGAASNDLRRTAPVFRQLPIAFENLRIAHHRIERRAQFVAETHHIAALGLVSSLGLFLGALQFGVGFGMRVDFLEQQRVLARAFFLGHQATVMRQHQEPGHHPRSHRKHKEYDQQRAAYDIGRVGRRADGKIVDQAQNAAQDSRGDCHGDAVAPQPGLQFVDGPLRQDTGGHRMALRAEMRMRLAHVMAARIERTAQRTDRRRIGWAPGHVLGLEWMLADRAGQRLHGLPLLARLAGEGIFALGGPGDGR